MGKKKLSRVKDPEKVAEKGFSKEYWDENYSELDTMDGVVNAREHALYLKALFRVQTINIKRILDLGCGLGHLGVAMANTFKVQSYLGVEPSAHAFKEFRDHQLENFKTNDCEIIKTDIISFLESEQFQDEKPYDLGICSSVLQYLDDDSIHDAMQSVFKKCRYLYISAPTDIELDRQIDDLEFFDRYAIRRSKEQYMKLIRPYFNFVSWRLLESKYFFDEKDTKFHDFLFRFE